MAISAFSSLFCCSDLKCEKFFSKFVKMTGIFVCSIFFVNTKMACLSFSFFLTVSFNGYTCNRHCPQRRSVSFTYIKTINCITQCVRCVLLWWCTFSKNHPTTETKVDVATVIQGTTTILTTLTLSSE